MHTIPVPVASKDPNQKINKRNRKDSAHVSQIIHEIMNQLSVIWFCNHQLRDLLSGDLDEAQRKQFEVIARAVNPNPTFFQPREASEPYSRGQWDSALKATPHSPEGDVSYVGASERTARSDAHGFRSRRPRLLLTVLQLLSDWS